MALQWLLQQLPDKTNDKIKIHLIDWESRITHCQVCDFPTTPSILSLRNRIASPAMMTVGSFLGDYSSVFLHNSLGNTSSSNQSNEGQRMNSDP